MELFSREKFFNFLFESSEIKLNTQSNNKLMYLSNVHEYLIDSPASGKVYLKPDKNIFDTEVTKLPEYLKLQDTLVKDSSLNDARKLEKDIQQLSIYRLFSPEIKQGWFTNIFNDLIEMGVEEPIAQEIKNVYPNLNKFSDEAKSAFISYVQDKLNYAIAKIDILVHYSTLGAAE